MILTIFDVLQGLINILFIGVILGFVVYLWVPTIESWEAGVKKVFTFVFEIMYEGFTGKSSKSSMINTELILTNEEVLELSKRLNGHPYDALVIREYQPNINEISWYNCTAYGLIREYVNISHEELVNLCTHVIQQYFIETRNIAPAVYIKVASATRLYFAIPLSEKAREYLEQQMRTQMDLSNEKVPSVLELEVDIFGNEETDNDIRL